MYNGQLVECSICHKNIKGVNNLKFHMRIHTGERPYSCTFCEKKFKQKSHLDQHLRTHTGERPYSCKNCGRAFVQKANLTEHGRHCPHQIANTSDRKSVISKVDPLKLKIKSVSSSRASGSLPTMVPNPYMEFRDIKHEVPDSNDENSRLSQSNSSLLPQITSFPCPPMGFPNMSYAPSPSNTPAIAVPSTVQSSMPLSGGVSTTSFGSTKIHGPNIPVEHEKIPETPMSHPPNQESSKQVQKKAQIPQYPLTTMMEKMKETDPLQLELLLGNLFKLAGVNV